MSKQSEKFTAPIEGEGTGRLVASFTNPAKVMRYTQAAASMELLVGNPLPIQDVILHDAELTDRDTGEIVNTVRSILITKDGKAYATLSKSVFTSIQMLCGDNMYGSPPWSPPIILEVVKVETRAGKAFRLVPVVED